MKIEKDKIIEIKSRVDIVDLISEYITLKKKGTNLFGICPFHSEKTPSFSVNPSKQFFRCFGCGEGGDIFEFIEKIEKIHFPEALVKLAERCGIQLEEITAEEAKEAKRKVHHQRMLFRINELANGFFQENLKNNQDSLSSVLSSRNLNQESVNTFQIGYAPHSWNALTTFFSNKKVPLKLASTLGLIKLKPKANNNSDNINDYYDAFRHRIVFPIFNTASKVIGFSCRKIDVDSEEDKKNPKYINSPESEIYKKRNSLYGINVAHSHINSKDSVIVVEGNLDCITMSSHGFKNTVATLGTALTQNHVESLRRLSGTIILIFDNDKAGEAATKKAFDLFSAAGITTVKTLTLPNSHDPDDYLRNNGPKKLTELLGKAKYLIDHFIDKELYLIQNPSPTDKVQIYKKCESYIQQISDPLSKQSYYRHIGNTLGLRGKNAITNEQSKEPRKHLKPIKSIESLKMDKAEETLLKIILHSPLLESVSFKRILATNIFELFSTPSLVIIGHEYLKVFSQLNFDNNSEKGVNENNYNKVISDIMLRTMSEESFSKIKPIFMDLISTSLEVDKEQFELILSDCITKITARKHKQHADKLLDKIRNSENNDPNTLKEYQDLLSKQFALSKEA